MRKKKDLSDHFRGRIQNNPPTLRKRASFEAISFSMAMMAWEKVRMQLEMLSDFFFTSSFFSLLSCCRSARRVFSSFSRNSLSCSNAPLICFSVASVWFYKEKREMSESRKLFYWNKWTNCLKPNWLDTSACSAVYTATEAQFSPRLYLDVHSCVITLLFGFIEVPQVFLQRDQLFLHGGLERQTSIRRHTVRFDSRFDNNQPEKLKISGFPGSYKGKNSSKRRKRGE